MKIKYVENTRSSEKEYNSFKLNLKREKECITDVEINKGNIICKNPKQYALIQDTLKINYEVGDKVHHKLEDIYGKVSFVCDDYASIKWEDGFKEKFYVMELQKYIELDTSNKVHSDNIDIESINEVSIDMEKAEMKRKLDVIENDNKKELIKNVKTFASEEVIDLAISKGMIDEDDREMETQMLSLMNEEEYEKYKQEVLDFSNEHEVTSRAESRDNRTEAEKMLDRVRGTGGITGGFNSDSNISPNSNSDTRDLSDIGRSKLIIGDDFKMETFEDQFTSLLSKGMEKISELNHDSNMENKSGYFDNMIGISKPIQIASTNKSTELKDLFGELKWSR